MINPSLKDLNLSSEELKEIFKLLAKRRGIKGYKSISEDYQVLSCLKCSSKPVKKNEKPKIHFSKAKTAKIKKEFSESKHKFSKSKINEI